LPAALDKLTSLLLGLALPQWARQTGFVQRKERKLSPLLFVQSAILLVTQGTVSLSRWAVLIGILGRFTLSKQAVWDRMTQAAVAFLQAVLAGVLARRAQRPSDGTLAQALRAFRRVLLQDSTAIKLCAALAEAFPSAGNQRDKPYGQLKIQAIFDLVGERFVHFGLSSFRRNDQSASVDILQVLQSGDLVVRDLGYFAVAVFQKIQEAEAFFLSRLHLGIGVWDARGEQKLDLLKELRKHGQLDRSVCLGPGKYPVRLVALPLPPEVAAQRRRKARQSRDKRSVPSPRHLALLGWSIFVTNVSQSVLSAQQVGQLYGIRWRIETIFKSWKSHFELTNVPEGSAEQLQSMIYGRLILLAGMAEFWAGSGLGGDLESKQSAGSWLKVAWLLADFVLLLFMEAWGKRVGHAWIMQVAYHGRYERRRRANFIEKFTTLP